MDTNETKKQPASQAAERKPAPKQERPVKKPAPDGAAKKAAPDGAAKKTAPEGSAKKAAPDGAAKKTAPDGTAKKPAPEGTAKKPAPAKQEASKPGLLGKLGFGKKKFDDPIGQKSGPSKPASQQGTKKSAPQGTKKAPASQAQKKPRPEAAPTETEEQPVQSAPDRQPEMQRKPQQRQEAQTEARSAPREGQRRPKAPSAMDTGSRPMGARKPAPKRKMSDSGYMPHQKANEKKKKLQEKQMRNFLAGKNKEGKPLLRFGTTAKPMTEEEQEKARRRAVPAVIYTEPRAFSRTRLALQLVSVMAVVMAFVLGLSVFFRVKTITVSGAGVYSPWAVREVSGINVGDNLLTFGRARAAGQIMANLPYVKNARIGIKLPDTVKIEIEEEDVVYSITSDDGIWWLINSEGKVIEQTNSSNANNYTKVLGVELAAPQVGQIALPAEAFSLGSGSEEDAKAEAETVSEEMLAELVTAQSRLDAAMQILRALEANDIVGEAASVDVSRMNDIVLWYGTRYQVNLGDSSNMEYKIACMVDVILQMSDYQNGILDISFTHWPDQVGFTPFS